MTMMIMMILDLNPHFVKVVKVQVVKNATEVEWKETRFKFDYQKVFDMIKKELS
jgi:hypothetical protein